VEDSSDFRDVGIGGRIIIKEIRREDLGLINLHIAR
jgi:hypothetical protein